MLTLFHAPKSRSGADDASPGREARGTPVFKEYAARITSRAAFKRMMEKGGAS